MVDRSKMAYNRSAVIIEPLLPGGGVMRTPFVGNVRSVPPPPPNVSIIPQQSAFGFLGGGGSEGIHNGLGTCGGGYGSSYVGGGGYGSSFGGYGSGYGAGFGSYGSLNRFSNGLAYQNNSNGPENRFIQMVEASSRPAFQSIESLVLAIGNIASMLDSTFFALTSSFRAILGVAENFGRLRGVFSQFWQTFEILRSLSWIYRKILYWLKISKLDPSSVAFKKAFSDALANQAGETVHKTTLPRPGQSPWPVIAFLSFILSAPFLVMKLVGTVTNTAIEESRNPEKWIEPIETISSFDFKSRNPAELTIHAGQKILVAPREIQNTNNLLNTGWGLATIDGFTSGLVPINYLMTPTQIRNIQKQDMLVNQDFLQPNYFPKKQLNKDSTHMSTEPSSTPT